MKTIRILLLSASLFLFNQKIMSQVDTTSNTLVMRTFEYYSGAYSSEIVIAHSNGSTETIELGSLKPKNREESTAKINYVINKILKSGYKLISGHSGGGDLLLSSTYIFMKDAR
jgi:hypothetical protein